MKTLKEDFYRGDIIIRSRRHFRPSFVWRENAELTLTPNGMCLSRVAVTRTIFCSFCEMIRNTRGLKPPYVARLIWLCGPRHSSRTKFSSFLCKLMRYVDKASQTQNHVRAARWVMRFKDRKAVRGPQLINFKEIFLFQTYFEPNLIIKISKSYLILGLQAALNKHWGGMRPTGRQYDMPEIDFKLNQILA